MHACMDAKRVDRPDITRTASSDDFLQSVRPLRTRAVDAPRHVFLSRHVIRWCSVTVTRQTTYTLARWSQAPFHVTHPAFANTQDR